MPMPLPFIFKGGPQEERVGPDEMRDCPKCGSSQPFTIYAVWDEFGVWPLLMFVFVVKCADIGAYTTGSLFGKHRFSPKISPGKTWEGIAGAVLFAMIIAVLFAVIFGIMVWPLALLFGFSFAFIGQLGDLAESMLKRDARQKNASDNVPGFGGLLDVIDSPLAAAPFAYLFFVLVLH